MTAEDKPTPAPHKSRRITASAARVLEIIAAGQLRGLTPSAVVLQPDGSTEIRYYDATTVKLVHKPKGWKV